MRLLRRREDGVAAVEAALVLPFLMLLLFGIVEFASAYAHQNDVRGAALTAARIAARTDGSLCPRADSPRVVLRRPLCT